MKIINENVVNLIVALKRFEGDFSKELNVLKESGQCADCEEISKDFFNGYSEIMKALKGLLLETAELNINNLILQEDNV